MLGYCTERNLRIVAYEFATMGSLHDVLHGTIPHILYNLFDNSSYLNTVLTTDKFQFHFLN
jgi:hypothetical protein